jgi:hypothetical protein
MNTTLTVDKAEGREEVKQISERTELRLCLPFVKGANQ